MRYFYFLFVFILVGCKSTSVSDAAFNTGNANSKAIDKIFSYKVEEASVSQTLKTLSSDEMQGRESGTEGINKAANYLADILQQYKVQDHMDQEPYHNMDL
jgi:hypothetical protein